LIKRDIIVVGASAGGVEALSELVSAFPPDVPAAILIVLHIPAWNKSNLPQILERRGPLQVSHARDQEPIEKGHIYVAPPDHHLLVEEGRTVLWRGPRENRFRPAINTLFRAAAGAYGRRAVGVVLSGALDDGSAGSWWIQRYGGAVVVQDPKEALIPDMPLNVLKYCSSAVISPVSEMGLLLVGFARGEEVRECQQKRA
jgi:two-component system, chemotaxis family, protein-glutamate methylesterase/glutaminase